MAASNIYDSSRLLESLKAVEYSPAALRAMNDNLAAGEAASARMVQSLKDAGTNVLDTGAGIRDFKTDQVKNMLAQASRAGMQLDPITGQPVDPTGANLTAIMDKARTSRDNATGFSDMSGMVDITALDQYQNKLAGDRRVKAEEFRKVAEEKQLRSMDADNQRIKKLQGESAQQSLNINRWTEESRQLKAQLDQDIGEENRKIIQAKANAIEEKIKNELANQVETNKGLKSSRLFTDAKRTSAGVVDLQTKAKTSLLGEDVSYKQQQIKELTRKNKEAELVITNREEMAKQFAQIRTAEEIDAKTGPVDFFSSKTYAAYKKAFAANAGNSRKNDILRAEFQDRIKNLDLPITEAQLFKAGVRTNPVVDEFNIPILEGEYDYSPSAQARLDKILYQDHKAKFGTQGPPSPAILKEMGVAAKNQVQHLSVGFTDASTLAAKGKIARDTENFTEALKDKVKIVDGLDRGARTAKIKELRKELIAMPGSTKEAIDAALGKFSDEDLDFIKIDLAPEGRWGKKDGIEPTDPKFGKVKWDQKELAKYGLSTINLKSKRTTKATFDTYETHIIEKLKNSSEGRRASDAAIKLKAGKILALIPGYTTARKHAVIKQEAVDLVNKVNVETDAVIAQQVADMRTSIAQDGHIAFMTGYLEKNHAKAFASSQLEDMQESLRGVIATAEELYYDKIHEPLTGAVNKAARAELYHAVLKMYTGSTGDSTWWWHNTTGPKGTDAGYLGSGIGDTGIEDLKGDAFRSAISPHLPDNLLTKLSDTEKIRNLKNQIAIIEKNKKGQ